MPRSFTVVSIDLLVAVFDFIFLDKEKLTGFMKYVSRGGRGESRAEHLPTGESRAGPRHCDAAVSGAAR